MYLGTTQYRLIYRQGLVTHLYIIVQFIQMYRFTHKDEISEIIARNLLIIFYFILGSSTTKIVSFFAKPLKEWIQG